MRKVLHRVTREEHLQALKKEAGELASQGKLRLHREIFSFFNYALNDCGYVPTIIETNDDDFIFTIAKSTTELH
jgi:hypothetical protein